jgi:hypothetical protein
MAFRKRFRKNKLEEPTCSWLALLLSAQGGFMPAPIV